jgi:predicted protein tyrosine phosphatase
MGTGSSQTIDLVFVLEDSNIARMGHRRGSWIIVSAYYHLSAVIEQADSVVCILGRSDKLPFPDIGHCKGLRLKFDDVNSASKEFVAPSPEQIGGLIAFGRHWNGKGTLIVSCRAGSARSPAAAMIVAAALGWPDSTMLARKIRLSRSYYRPNEAMLKLADRLISPCPGLVEMNRSVPLPTHTDDWEPVRIPLAVIKDT